MSSTHTDIDKAAALVAVEICEREDYPLNAAASLTGIPRRTLARWESEQLDDPSPTIHNARVAIRSEFKQEVERLRGMILARAVQAIESDEKIPFKDLMAGLKTTNEISQLLGSQPTSITEQRQSADQQRREIAEAALDAIMAHKRLERAAAIAYLQERQPDLAAWVQG